MSTARSSLGRGLGPLSDEVSQADTPVSLTSSRGFFQVPVESIATTATGTGPAGANAALAESVRVHGILQPILVRKLAEGYELIDGRRRLDAARAAGARSVPALVLTDTAADAATVAAEANRHRSTAAAATAGGGWAGSALSRAAFLVLLLLVMAAGVLVGRRTGKLRAVSTPDRGDVTVAEPVALPPAGDERRALVGPPEPDSSRPAAPDAPPAMTVVEPTPAAVPEPLVAAAEAPAPEPEPLWATSLAVEGVRVGFTNGVADVAFAEPVFSSYATLSAEGAARLRDVAGRLAAAAPLAITVRGHTDPTPVRSGGRYVDNFDLALDRAISVLQFLRYHCGLTNAALLAVSCAEVDPPFPNDTPESALRNRTVTLRITASP